ncbi:hypothetical protein G5714_001666 [Onychostoma macrolepis]|uniref:Uncharacterized protein n=1 Tax=Onychostoma macrolepis TaxID=369639 RepID=A0A7J6DCU3_9TELE|nr:hypothetical protein G5714_001666 [Onychostoma macrolepis]
MRSSPPCSAGAAGALGYLENINDSKQLEELPGESDASQSMVSYPYSHILTLSLSLSRTPAFSPSHSLSLRDGSAAQQPEGTEARHPQPSPSLPAQGSGRMGGFVLSGCRSVEISRIWPGCLRVLPPPEAGLDRGQDVKSVSTRCNL